MDCRGGRKRDDRESGKRGGLGLGHWKGWHWFGQLAQGVCPGVLFWENLWPLGSGRWVTRWLDPSSRQLSMGAIITAWLISTKRKSLFSLFLGRKGKVFFVFLFVAGCFVHYLNILFFYLLLTVYVWYLGMEFLLCISLNCVQRGVILCRFPIFWVLHLQTCSWYWCIKSLMYLPEVLWGNKAMNVRCRLDNVVQKEKKI